MIMANFKIPKFNLMYILIAGIITTVILFLFYYLPIYQCQPSGNLPPGAVDGYPECAFSFQIALDRLRSIGNYIIILLVAVIAGFWRRH